MGLNDLQLSPEVIARLYPAYLVTLDYSEAVHHKKSVDVVSVANKETEPASVKDWKSLGNNQKNILIVVKYTELVHLPDEELGFLTNMLAACKLSLDDVIIINQNNYEETRYKDILANFQSRIVFLFGIDPIAFGLPVGFPHFQVQNVAGCTFLFAPALEECGLDKLLKSKLWVSLRSIFGI